MAMKMALTNSTPALEPNLPGIVRDMQQADGEGKQARRLWAKRYIQRAP